MATRCDDPMRHKQLNDADELEGLMAEAAALSNYLLQHPNDVEAQKRLQEVLNRIAERTDSLIDPSKRVEGNRQFTAAELLKAAQDVTLNPRDQNAQQRLEKILTNLPLDDLETQDEKLASMVDHQHDLLAQLTSAAERGDKQAVENLSQ
jgi:ribosomal protein S15P/S13E